jgi:hypothetical protein
MADTRTVYASIGNSDDKLTQARWAEFHDKVGAAVRGLALQVYGDWASAGADPWQNACIAFEIGHETSERLKRDLAELAAEYGQDSIAWAEADTKFIGPATAAPVADLAPNTLADDILNWVREHPGDGTNAPTGPFIIEQDPDGTVRIVDPPDDAAIDIALLRHRGLTGVAFANGVLTIDTEAGPARYLPMGAIDYGFTIVFRREPFESDAVSQSM